ncbi:hypothetical protein YC2023_076995 [Brassica napus]
MDIGIRSFTEDKTQSNKNDFHGFTVFTVLFPGMKDLDLDPPFRLVRPDIGQVRELWCSVHFHKVCCLARCKVGYGQY